MNNRIMIKLSVSDDCISLRTFSRGYQSPQRFILTEKELLELEEKGYLTVSDIRSFAKLALRKTAEQGEVLEIEFTWLSDAGGGKVSGMTETIRISYEEFKEMVEESRKNGIQKRMLSLEEKPSQDCIPEQEKPESSGGDKGIAEETGKVHGRAFPEMERQQTDHFV